MAGIQEQADAPSFSVPIMALQSQSESSWGLFFKLRQSYKPSFVEGFLPAGPGAGLELCTSCSQGAHNLKPIDHPWVTEEQIGAELDGE